ncbi:RNA 2',3'-cyclic phosphodiesterase [Paratractidigestivibacter sp.]|uniref:RNA 2',3'-cyclic phosphodiesterase n=2 Tax=Paratractidigestivibacter sp. TaxID=2847316 RepID=UPI002ABDE864|nr:RNA 2',3'-cyclic phosphodiesterase [Paratractidigestivibacter sp.]
MRAFIALEMPEEFVDDAAALARQLQREVDGRFVPAENYHLTLAFLGEINEAVARDAMDVMDAACATAGPMPIDVIGLGAFGKCAGGAGLWLEIAKDPELMALAGRVREGLASRGVAFDGSFSFSPHVTLARRAKLPGGDLPQLTFPLPCEAVQVTLFRSYLEKNGPRYKPLYAVEFG